MFIRDVRIEILKLTQLYRLELVTEARCLGLGRTSLFFQSFVTNCFHSIQCVHSGIRPYKCEECGMTFARQDSWKGHTHSKVRSFLCSICGKTFARRNIRDTHERAHLNDRRYPCSYCGKKFMTNQQRTNHERTHTGEKPFQV